MKIKLNTKLKKLLADTLTPVDIYLKVRDKFPNSLLLESSDYKSKENSHSFICLNPIAEFKLQNSNLSIELPDGHKKIKTIKNSAAIDELQKFIKLFEVKKVDSIAPAGLFGYTSYNSIKYFEDIDIEFKTKEEKAIPDMYYNLFQIVIVINHFNGELFIVEFLYKNNESIADRVESVIKSKNYNSFGFELKGKEKSNYSNKDFLNSIKKIKNHCKRGDVFQLVLSREFSQKFIGDEFNVYRCLRSINPSPYLFYFDYGNFKLFGSSPEAQLTIKNKKASIYPIAGTYKRSGVAEQDIELSESLTNDKKENSEHVMLVDLARNDLSKHCENVSVEKFKEIQFYSHVIHLVSQVTGTIDSSNPFKIVADTFPAGTLSGAPKHKAMQLINQYENTSRGFYGGCVGFLGFNGDFNHAIMIRTFLSKNNQLFYQAGAGIVDSSLAINELNEVNNKLLALKKAMKMAQTI